MRYTNDWRPLWDYAEVLSWGWSNLSKTERRAHPEYVTLAEVHTQTNERLAHSRTRIVELATEADIQPPLNRREVRLGMRNDELCSKLGATAVDLLAAHDVAVANNYDAMARLRDEDNRIAAMTLVGATL